jgi:elongator complex protein 3
VLLVPELTVRRPRKEFDPTPHRRELVAIIDEIVGESDFDSRTLDRILKKYPRSGTGFFSRSEIIAGFRRFGSTHQRDLDPEAFVERLRLRPIRTLSGVTPVTVLTKPYPCPGKCIFCPNDVRMPKSYLSNEPGAQRAEDNRFDPYLQTWNRLRAYQSMGHPVAKVELIVLGGTWSFHPEAYQIWFVKRCFDALNDFGKGVDRRAEAGAAPVRFRELPSRLNGRESDATYNQLVGGLLRETHGPALLDPSERANWLELEAAHLVNETAACRSVGLVVETRPDHISSEEVRRIRRLGGTKVQIGLQSLSDRVLEANRRGCDVAASRRALRLLRGAGFKLHAHWMPNLLGSSAEQDADDFARLFDDPDFRPDELKLYPCSLIESAELMGNYERGEWRPYRHDELVDLLAGCLERTPSYCRLTRVIRDFSSRDIVAGNQMTNLREVAEDRLRGRGGVCRDIRAREIRGSGFSVEALRLKAQVYRTSIGEEHFLEFATPEDRLVAFLRLSLPVVPLPDPELRTSALIREVHVYGDSLGLGRRAEGRAQHMGLGRRLIDRAAQLARDAGFEDLAVISAVGTRVYYRSLGFSDGDHYQHRSPTAY